MVDTRRPLKKLRKRRNQALSKYSEAIRGELSHLDRLKFKAIVVIEIHSRDVIEKMYRASKSSERLSDFQSSRLTPVSRPVPLVIFPNVHLPARASSTLRSRSWSSSSRVQAACNELWVLRDLAVL